MNKIRFEAFSDAVFAFAITLLALGFVLPGIPIATIVSFALYLLLALYFFVPKRTRAENPITAREW